MVSVRIELTGDKKFKASLDRARKLGGRRLNKLLASTALSVQDYAVTSIQHGPKTGRIYTRRTVSHQASSPGQAPATDTGELVRNITVERNNYLNYDVGSRKGAPQGFWLEMGTQDMAARPWLKPAFNKAVKEFDQKVDRMWGDLF